MARYENQTFQDETVALDGNEYVNCNFVRCTLTYGGEGTVQFNHCRMEKYQFRFVGAASRTLGFLSSMRNDAAFGAMVNDVIRGLNGHGNLVFG